MDKKIAIIAASGIVALLAGLWYASLRTGGDIYAQCRQGQIAGGTGSIGGPFTLVDHTGRTVTDADVITGPTLLYFGYTFCPDICPADTARNAEAVDLLEAEGYMVTPMMISIDPQRDTPEMMADFIFNLHERMIGLTGTAEQVKIASQAYKTYYRQHESDDEFYLVDHSTFSYLVLPGPPPGGGTVAFFRREHTAGDIAATTACFIDASS